MMCKPIFTTVMTGLEITIQVYLACNLNSDRKRKWISLLFCVFDFFLQQRLHHHIMSLITVFILVGLAVSQPLKQINLYFQIHQSINLISTWYQLDYQLHQLDFISILVWTQSKLKKKFKKETCQCHINSWSKKNINQTLDINLICWWLMRLISWWTSLIVWQNHHY